MSTHKWIDRICVAVILLSLAVTILFMNGERLGITVVTDADAEETYASAYFSANDLKADWDTSGATVIVLNGDSAKITGNGAYWLDGSLTIVQSGQYVISGELTDGNIVVNAEDFSKVWILLNGVTVTCSDDACIRVDQADKVFLTLADGMENTLTGPAAYSEEALAIGVDAVLFSHDDLTINGSGSLTVSASFLSGISSKDDLMITGGTISVTTLDHGIEVNDRFHVTAASLTIDAGQDGIHSDLEFVMQDGSLVITAGDDGIHADSLIRVDGGNLQITDCYEGLEASVIEQYGGDITIQAKDDALNANGYTGYAIGDMRDRESEAQAGEQIVVTAEETYVLIAGGTMTITNTTGIDADGIDSNGNITITGGTIRIFMVNNGGNSPLDCGTEAGGQAVITGGTVIACGNYSMAESFDSASSQCSILYNISDGISAGSTVSLMSADGETLLSTEVPYSFSSVILSCPVMTVGSSYRVVIGDNEEEITLIEISASYGDASSQMFTGTMNWGGMQPMHQGPGGTPPAMPDGEGMGEPPTFPEGDADGTPPPRPDGEEFEGQFSFPEGGPAGTPPAFPENSGDGNPPAFSGDTADTAPAALTEVETAETQPENADAAVSTGEADAAPEVAAPSDSDMMRMGHPGSRNPGEQRQGSPMEQNHQENRAEFRTDETAQAQDAGTETSDWLLVAASVLILAVGILLAVCFRRSQHIEA